MKCAVPLRPLTAHVFYVNRKLNLVLDDVSDSLYSTAHVCSVLRAGIFLHPAYIGQSPKHISSSSVRLQYNYNKFATNYV